jgi:hypothetical protein
MIATEDTGVKVFDLKMLLGGWRSSGRHPALMHH